jgi:hypothetical protein
VSAIDPEGGAFGEPMLNMAEGLKVAAEGAETKEDIEDQGEDALDQIDAQNERLAERAAANDQIARNLESDSGSREWADEDPPSSEDPATGWENADSSSADDSGDDEGEGGDEEPSEIVNVQAPAPTVMPMPVMTPDLGTPIMSTPTASDVRPSTCSSHGPCAGSAMP